MKIKKILLALLICVFCTACSKEETKPEVKVKDKKTEEIIKHDYQIDEELPNELMFDNGWGVEFLINTPGRYAAENTGGCYETNMKDYAVEIDSYLQGSSNSLYNVDLDKITSIEQILPQMEKQFIDTLTSLIKNNEETTLTIESTEKTKINNWEMVHYTGYFNVGKDERGNSVYANDRIGFGAYAMFFAVEDGKDVINMPIYFAGVDISSEQAYTRKANDMALKMAKSFRLVNNKDNNVTIKKTDNSLTATKNKYNSQK